MFFSVYGWAYVQGCWARSSFAQECRRRRTADGGLPWWACPLGWCYGCTGSAPRWRGTVHPEAAERQINRIYLFFFSIYLKVFRKAPENKYTKKLYRTNKIMFQTLNSDIRLMGAYSRESVELYGLLNTRGGLSITPTWIKKYHSKMNTSREKKKWERTKAVGKNIPA